MSGSVGRGGGGTPGQAPQPSRVDPRGAAPQVPQQGPPGKVVVIDPVELKDAASAVADRFELGTAALRRIAGLDVGCEMPPGVAGVVKGYVTTAANTLVRSNGALGPLTSELLQRAGMAERADQAMQAFGGVVTYGGLVHSKAELASDKALWGASALPEGAKRWVDRAGRGLGVLGAVGTIGGSVANHAGNPFLTGAQKRELVVGESAATAGKGWLAGVIGAGVASATTAAAVGAGGGTVVAPGPGTVVGGAGAAALGFVAGTGAAIVASVGLDELDDAVGFTDAAVDVAGGVGDVGSAVGGAAEDAGGWIGDKTGLW